MRPWQLFRSSLLAVGLLGNLTAPGRGQDPPPPGPSPGHSYHGEAFNEGPRQRAYLMSGMPQVTFPITVKSAEGQQFFNQGVGQLHGFWYFEAERSFRQVLALDPGCAMAYWGLAMANTNNEGRAKTMIAKAVEKKAGLTPREALWIDALSGFHSGEPADNKERRRQYIRRLENIIHEYPEDLEAKAFLALQIWLNKDHDMAINSHQALDSLIGEVLAANPQHPVHHYRIHLWNYEKAGRARPSAALCGQSAPGIAHMWHMPGHIFSDLSRYTDAAWQQEASARVDHAHMMRDRVMPYLIHNYAHNNEWLIRDLNFVGRARDAITLAKNLIEVPRHPKYNLLNQGGCAQFGRSRLFETLAHFELWDDVLALSETIYLEPTDLPEEQIRRERLLGVARFGRGEVEAGRAILASLEAQHTKDKAAQDLATQEAETKARAESKPDDEINKAKAAAAVPFASKLQALDSALAELRGHAALADGQFAPALEQFGKTNGLSKDFLARVHLQAGDLAQAEQVAREGVDQGKYQIVPLATYTEVLARAGKRQEAMQAFEELRNLAAQADADLPLVKRLQPLAAGLGMPADWRNPAVVASDAGVRPPLDNLGPLRWTPSPASPFTLPDSSGAPLALESYRGRPVVVIFYLGFGCVHCVEQLQAFAPLTSEFATAGISLVAVSTDTPAALQEALAKRSAEGPFPFPLVSDAAGPDGPLATFRAYRAYDDFENLPLHATVLIDGAGLVRWQDISFDPFSDARFLLTEARRLLNQPAMPPEACPPAKP